MELPGPSEFEQQLIDEVFGWTVAGCKVDPDGFYDDEAGGTLRAPSGQGLGDLLVGFDELPGGKTRLVLRQLYLAKSQTGIGSEVLLALIEMMERHPKISYIDIPATDDGSYVWARMGVRCADDYHTLRNQVLDHFDERLASGELGLLKEEVEPVLTQVRHALADDDPTQALLDIRTPSGQLISPQIMEGVEWLGRITREDAPGLKMSLQARLQRLQAERNEIPVLSSGAPYRHEASADVRVEATDPPLSI